MGSLHAHVVHLMLHKFHVVDRWLGVADLLDQVEILLEALFLLPP